jgi:hypothetical protein
MAKIEIRVLKPDDDRSGFISGDPDLDRFLQKAVPNAVEYYRRYGFEELEILEGALGDRPAPVSMFLPLASIIAPGQD